MFDLFLVLILRQCFLPSIYVTDELKKTLGKTRKKINYLRKPTNHACATKNRHKKTRVAKKPRFDKKKRIKKFNTFELMGCLMILQTPLIQLELNFGYLPPLLIIDSPFQSYLFAQVALINESRLQYLYLVKNKTGKHL